MAWHGFEPDVVQVFDRFVMFFCYGGFRENRVFQPEQVTSFEKQIRDLCSGHVLKLLFFVRIALLRRLWHCMSTPGGGVIRRTKLSVGVGGTRRSGWTSRALHVENRK